MDVKACASCGDLLNGLVYECIGTDANAYVGYACCVREKRHSFLHLGGARRVYLGSSADKLLTEDEALAAIQSMPGLWSYRVRDYKYIVNELMYEKAKFTKKAKQL